MRNDEERTFLLETVVAQAKRAEMGSQLLRDVLAVLRALIEPKAASRCVLFDIGVGSLTSASWWSSGFSLCSSFAVA